MDNNIEIGIERLLEIVTKCDCRVLHVPILSMRSYETNLYELSCDGNFNRLVSVWVNVIKKYNEKVSRISDPNKRSKEKKLDVYVIVPSRDKMTEASYDLIKRADIAGNGSLHFMMLDSFPAGGPKQERGLSGVIKLCADCETIIKEKFCGSLVVYEPEYVGVSFESLKKSKCDFTTIFWCPVSETASCHPSFLENVKFVDLELAKSCDYLMVATENQEKYFTTSCKDREDFVFINSMLVDPSLPLFTFTRDNEIIRKIDLYHKVGYNIVYFPFRMTDPGYKFNEVMSALLNLAGQGYKIMFLYSDPNESNEVDKYLDDFKFFNAKDNFIEVNKVSTSRDTYYTCISDKRCIIPYFEAIKDIMHASWQEMEYYGSTVVSTSVITSLSIEKTLQEKMRKPQEEQEEIS